MGLCGACEPKQSKSTWRSRAADPTEFIKLALSQSGKNSI